MASPAATLKFCLFSYPSIFPEPVNVLNNWFTSIGSVYWSTNGEIVSSCAKIPENIAMSYDDLDEREKTLTERYTSIGSPLNVVFGLQIEAERIRRKFIADNIDKITKDSYNWTFNFFGHAFKNCESGRTENIYSGCTGLNFPDNITQEWGEVLYRYYDHWLQTINERYGVGRKGKEEDHWPEDIKVAYKSIKDAKARLHPIIRDGETYEEHCNNVQEIMRKMFDELR